MKIDVGIRAEALDVQGARHLGAFSRASPARPRLLPGTLLLLISNWRSPFLVRQTGWPRAARHPSLNVIQLQTDIPSLYPSDEPAPRRRPDRRPCAGTLILDSRDLFDRRASSLPEDKCKWLEKSRP
jgi:hypothetical protein